MDPPLRHNYSYTQFGGGRPDEARLSRAANTHQKVSKSIFLQDAILAVALDGHKAGDDALMSSSSGSADGAAGSDSDGAGKVTAAAGGSRGASSDRTAAQATVGEAETELAAEELAGRAPGEAGGNGKPRLPRPEGCVACPRCASEETKFCYYNNYNVKQPRYFCKARARTRLVSHFSVMRIAALLAARAAPAYAKLMSECS